MTGQLWIVGFLQHEKLFILEFGEAFTVYMVVGERKWGNIACALLSG
jgi:hypothetical protein